jgi:hypothetical protein
MSLNLFRVEEEPDISTYGENNLKLQIVKAA